MDDLLTPTLQTYVWVLAIRLAITFVWDVSTISGLILTHMNVHDAARDRRNLYRAKPGINGIVRMEAEGAVFDQKCLRWAQLVFFLVGALATLTLVLNPPVPTPASLASALTVSLSGIAIVSGSVAMTWASFNQKHRRGAQLSMLQIVEHTLRQQAQAHIQAEEDHAQAHDDHAKAHARSVRIAAEVNVEPPPKSEDQGAA